MCEDEYSLESLDTASLQEYKSLVGLIMKKSAITSCVHELEEVVQCYKAVKDQSLKDSLFDAFDMLKRLIRSWDIQASEATLREYHQAKKDPSVLDDNQSEAFVVLSLFASDTLANLRAALSLREAIVSAAGLDILGVFVQHRGKWEEYRSMINDDEFWIRARSMCAAP